MHYCVLLRILRVTCHLLMHDYTLKFDRQTVRQKDNREVIPLCQPAFLGGTKFTHKHALKTTTNNSQLGLLVYISVHLCLCPTIILTSLQQYLSG